MIATRRAARPAKRSKPALIMFALVICAQFASIAAVVWIVAFGAPEPRYFRVSQGTGEINAQ